MTQLDVIYSKAVSTLLDDHPDLSAKLHLLERAGAPIQYRYTVVMELVTRILRGPSQAYVLN